MSIDFEFLKDLNERIRDVDKAQAQEKLSELEKKVQEEISDLENGQVLWMGFGMSLEQIEEKLALRNKVLRNIQAWQEVFNVRD